MHPYSTGRYLAAEFAARDWPAVAVVPERPLAVHAHARSFRPQDYAAVVTDSGDAMATAAELAALDVTAVMPGCESGIHLADVLASQLGLPGNDPCTSAVRRDKGKMADALARAGLAHPRTIRAGTAAQARSAAQAIGGTVVVKPPASACGDGVTVCRSPEEVAAAWSMAAGKLNMMGLANDDLLIQEFLSGQQYTVNTVTCQRPGGRPVHYVAEVWRDCRREVPGGKVIYDRMDLLDGDDPRAERAGAYIIEVLDALDMVTGAAHSEVMVASKGPVLIEANVRLAGMGDPAAMQQALGESQVSLAVEAVTDPAGFARRHDHRPYRRLVHAVQLDLAADHAGILDPGTLAAIRALPSVCGWVGHLEPGDPVNRTVDLITSPGMFYLAGPAAQVEQDVARIRALETGLYG